MHKEDVVESIDEAIRFYTGRTGHSFDGQEVEISNYSEYLELEIGGKRFRVLVEEL